MRGARLRFGAWVLVAAGFGACGAKGGTTNVVSGTGGADGATGGAAGGEMVDSGPPDVPIGPRPDPTVPVFDESVVHDIKLTMSPDDWQSIIDDTRGDDWRHADIVYDGAEIRDVGVRPSGESSRFPGNTKMSLKVKFDAFPDRGHFGHLKEIKVKGMYGDQSMMRDRVSYFVFRSMVPTPRAAHARMVVNGDLRGLFTVVEVWDSQSIEDRFPMPSGPLYRVRGYPMQDPYLYVGDTLSSYMPLPWEPHINMPAVGDDVIPAFLKVLLNDPTKLDTVADVDELVAFLACNAILMNTDGFVGDTGVADHYQYYDPSTAKFSILPWDPDNVLGSLGEMPDRGIYTHFSRSTLARVVRDAGNYRTRYKDKIKALMAAIPVEMLQAEIATIHAQIIDAAHEDPIKPFSNATFDWNLMYLQTFAAARYAAVAGQL